MKQKNKLIGLGVFALSGLVLLSASFATNIGSVDYTVRNGATLQDDQLADGGSFVLFQSPPTPTPTPTPTPEPTPQFDFFVNDKDEGPIADEGNLASNLWWYYEQPYNDDGADKISQKISVSQDGAPHSSGYFSSFVFIFSNYEKGGYIGLQTRTVGQDNQKGFIFSVWDTEVGESSGFKNTFSGEGTGTQTTIRNEWQENTPHTLIIEKDTARSNGTVSWWRGSVDTPTGNEVIGSIRTPAAWGKPVPHNSFLERYGDSNNTCGEFANAVTTFYEPRLNDSTFGTAVFAGKRIYSDCPNVYNHQFTENENTVEISISPGG